jgi:hypothetical protein
MALLTMAGCSGSSASLLSSSTTVGGIVTDSTGQVLSGVSVTAGTATTSTATNGTFSLTVPPQPSLVVSFSKAGYLESSKQLTATQGTSSHVAAALMAMAAPVNLDATRGDSVAGARGASLKVAPGVLVDGSGKTVSGSVQVSLTPLSPAVPGEFAAYPGALVGSVNGGPASLLQTYGVLDVTVTQNGQTVQVAPGKTVSVTIPVTATGKLPQTQDLWSFNLSTGIWDHEGTAQLAGSAYSAELSHFSYHNIDAAIQSGQATCVTGLVVDKSGGVVAGAYVSPSEGACVDGLIMTDASGRYCTWLLTGVSETIGASASTAPFGEGSVAVTGGPSVPFPGSYTCSNLDCTTAPNIVLGQTACTTDADCPSGYACCAADGEHMCLESFACTEAQAGIGTAPVSTCKADSDCTGGDVCCTIASSSTSGCLTSAECTLANSAQGGCSSSSTVTATISGQSYSFSCFYGELVSEGGSDDLAMTAAAAGATSTALEIALTSTDSFAGWSPGKTLSFATSGSQPQVALVVSGKDASGATFEMSPTNGSVTLDSWSTTTGGTVSVSISSGTTLSGFAIAGTRTTTVSGTVSGKATAIVVVAP